MYQDYQVALSIVAFVTPLVVGAMICDIRNRRLPNLILVTIALLSLGLHLAFDGLTGLADAFVGLVIGFGLLLPFYSFRMVGGGDIKLLAALGAFVGRPLILQAAAAGVILGGACSLLLLLRQGRSDTARRLSLIMTKLSSPKSLASDFASYDSLGPGRKEIPYGVYLGLGALATVGYHVWTLG